MSNTFVNIYTLTLLLPRYLNSSLITPKFFVIIINSKIINWIYKMWNLC